MKYIFALCFCLSCFQKISAQEKTAVDSLEFLTEKIPVPAGCTATSPYRLQCADYTMPWVYLDPMMLPSVPEQTMQTLRSQRPDFRKTFIRCTLTGVPVKGYRMSYSRDGEKFYAVFAYGKLGKQGVFFQLIMHQPLETNSKVPEPAKKIFRFSE